MISHSAGEPAVPEWHGRLRQEVARRDRGIGHKAHVRQGRDDQKALKALKRMV